MSFQCDGSVSSIVDPLPNLAPQFVLDDGFDDVFKVVVDCVLDDVFYDSQRLRVARYQTYAHL